VILLEFLQSSIKIGNLQPFDMLTGKIRNAIA